LLKTVDALGGVRWIRWVLSAQEPQKLDRGLDWFTLRAAEYQLY
jgi:hypothetical protein